MQSYYIVLFSHDAKIVPDHKVHPGHSNRPSARIAVAYDPECDTAPGICWHDTCGNDNPYIAAFIEGEQSPFYIAEGFDLRCNSDAVDGALRVLAEHANRYAPLPSVDEVDVYGERAL